MGRVIAGTKINRIINNVSPHGEHLVTLWTSSHKASCLVGGGGGGRVILAPQAELSF